MGPVRQTDVTMFDLAPSAIADILGDRLPGKVARAFRRFRYGPGAFKVDFAVNGGVPWTNRDAHEAGPCTSVGTSPRSLPPSATSMPGECRRRLGRRFDPHARL